jgi:Tfp pilus assembly protein PilN
MGHSASSDASHLKSENSMLAQSFNAQQSRIKEARQLQQTITSVESTKQKLEDILQNFQQIGEQRQRAYDYLCLSMRNPPEGILPNQAKLSSISQESGKLDLLGEAPSYELALEYADALRRTEGFSNVQVHSLTQSGDRGVVTFNISLEWE